MPISEYIIKQSSRGTALVKKIAAIAGYVLFAALLCFAIFALSPPLLYLPFLLIAIALVALAVFVTWRFLCVEYEIVIGNGEFCASIIYGKTVVRKLLSLPINDLSEIGIYDDEAYQRLCALSLQKNLVCVSSMSAPIMYYALYDDGKDHCVIYFETNEHGISILKKQNSSAFKH